MPDRPYQLTENEKLVFAKGCEFNRISITRGALTCTAQCTLLSPEKPLCPHASVEVGLYVNLEDVVSPEIIAKDVEGKEHEDWESVFEERQKTISARWVLPEKVRDRMYVNPVTSD